MTIILNCQTGGSDLASCLWWERYVLLLLTLSPICITTSRITPSHSPHFCLWYIIPLGRGSVPPGSLQGIFGDPRQRGIWGLFFPSINWGGTPLKRDFNSNVIALFSHSIWRGVATLTTVSCYCCHLKTST